MAQTTILELFDTRWRDERVGEGGRGEGEGARVRSRTLVGRGAWRQSVRKHFGSSVKHKCPRSTSCHTERRFRTLFCSSIITSVSPLPATPPVLEALIQAHAAFVCRKRLEALLQLQSEQDWLESWVVASPEILLRFRRQLQLQREHAEWIQWLEYTATDIDWRSLTGLDGFPDSDLE